MAAAIGPARVRVKVNHHHPMDYRRAVRTCAGPGRQSREYLVLVQCVFSSSSTYGKADKEKKIGDRACKA